MSTSVKLAAQRFLKFADFDFVQEATRFIQTVNDADLKLTLKVAGILWVLVALTTLVVWTGERNQMLIYKSEILKVTKEAHPVSPLQAKKSSVWNPGAQSQGECGALQDLNMRRLGNSTDINQLVNDAPPGFETWYRTQ